MTDAAPDYESLARTALVPPLGPRLYKGQAGRIGVLGGSEEYTGAPFFAAQTAMRMGADLAHIMCDKSAAIPIKTYSPELIVHPVSLAWMHYEGTTRATAELIEGAIKPILQLMPRLHAMVIGPGLGRDPFAMDCVERVIEEARKSKLPLVIDGDGLHLVTQKPHLAQGHEHAILTPNVNEFKRLCDKLDSGEGPIKALARALGNVTIVRKGDEDVISNGTETVVCRTQGSMRRCGGQGDILAGAIGTMLAWAIKHPLLILPKNASPTILAAMGGCLVTRECARLAFVRFGRSTTTTDLLAEVPLAFSNVVIAAVIEDGDPELSNL